MELSKIDNLKYHCTRPSDSVSYVCKLYFAVWSVSDSAWCEDVVNLSFRSLAEARLCVSNPEPYLKGYAKRFRNEHYVDFVIYRKSCKVL